MESIGSRLQRLRKKKATFLGIAELKQADAAAEMGYSRARYSNYENDIRNPQKEDLITLSEYYDTSIDYILKGEESSIVSQDSPFNDFKFALLNGENDLTEDQKQDLLDYYEFIKSKKGR